MNSEPSPSVKLENPQNQLIMSMVDSMQFEASLIISNNKIYDNNNSGILMNNLIFGSGITEFSRNFIIKNNGTGVRVTQCGSVLPGRLIFKRC